MKIRLTVAPIAAVLVLAACGGQSKPAAESSEVPASSAESRAAATSVVAAPGKGETPPRDFIVGKWGTDGDCEMATDLRADGTSDGPFGDWTYSDGAISFVDVPELKITVTVIDDDSMRSDNGESTSTMTRCP